MGIENFAYGAPDMPDDPKIPIEQSANQKQWEEMEADESGDRMFGLYQRLMSDHLEHAGDLKEEFRGIQKDWNQFSILRGRGKFNDLSKKEPEKLNEVLKKYFNLCNGVGI